MNANPLVHYVTIGQTQGRLPGVEANGVSSKDVLDVIVVEFDAAFYAQTYKSVSRSPFSPISHFINLGWRQDYDPHPEFSTTFYLNQNEDVRAAKINPFFHFIAEGRKEGRMPNEAFANNPETVALRTVVGREFDATFYLTQYPEVRSRGMEALHHYIEVGWRQGKDPNAKFSTTEYLQKYSDVAEANIEPFYHYLSEGRKEGRDCTANRPITTDSVSEVYAAISKEFDTQYYLTKYPDILRAGVDPVEHYIRHGWLEGRDPTPSFSTSYYLTSYQDIRDAKINPFYHFIAAGRLEGRRAQHPGGWKVSVLNRLNLSKEKRLLSRVEREESKGVATELSERLAAQRNVLLSFSHDNYTKSVGGVQLCLQIEQRNAQLSGWAYMNLYPVRHMNTLSSVTEPSDFLFGLVFDGAHLGNVTAADILPVLERHTLQGREFSIVVHSMLGHSTEIVEGIVKATDAERCMFWVHDYFAACPSYTLLRNQISYCAAPALNSQACSICLFGEERLTHNGRFQRLFREVNFHVLAPSQFALDLWLEKTSLPTRSANVVPHCRVEFEEQRQPSSDDRPYRIAFLGHPSEHKGWQTFLRLIDELAPDRSVDFFQLGAGPQAHSKVSFYRASVIEDGPDAMCDALKACDIDAVLLWSIWPETFSFVAYEAIAAGAFIVTNTVAGNICRLAADEDFGAIFSTEVDLIQSLKSGSLKQLLQERRQRKLSLGKLSYSGMTIEALAETIGQS